MSPSDDETLSSLYAKRQEVLKYLNEIDQSIRNHEILIERKKTSSPQFLVDEYLSENDVSGSKLSQFIARSMADVNGLREALRIVDACKCIQEREELYSPEKMRIRNGLVKEVTSNSICLSQHPLGSELMIKVIGILRSGASPPPLRPEPDQGGSASLPESELLLLTREIGESLPAVCCDTNGTRVVQKLVDSLMTQEEVSVFVNFIADCVSDLSKDINGNHSIAKLIPKLSIITEKGGEATPPHPPSDDLQKIIYPRLSDNCADICKNRQGCCIIQKCVELAPEPFKESFINAILSNALKLVQDPFGNYVVQHILDLEEGKGREAGEYINQIIRQMLHHISELSCNKFSSNVVEKCLKAAASDVRQLMIDELTDPQVLPKLLTDSFANYVIQTALSTSNDLQHNQLRDAITPHQALLKNSPYGVKIEAKLAKRHREIIRKQAANKKKENSFSKSVNNNIGAHLPTVFPPENPYSSNNYNSSQTYPPISMSTPEAFIPGMGFPALVGGDSASPIVRNVFAQNIPTEMPIYQSSVPVFLNTPSMVTFNQCADNISSNQPQAPSPTQAQYAGISMMHRNPMAIQYSSR